MSTSECLTSALTRRAGVHGVQFASKIFQLYASFPRIRDHSTEFQKVTLITAYFTAWSVKIDSDAIGCAVLRRTEGLIYHGGLTHLATDVASIH